MAATDIRLFERNGLKRLVVLGLAGLTVAAARFCRNNALACHCIASPRLAGARQADGPLIRDVMRRLGADVTIVEHLGPDSAAYTLDPNGTLVVSLGSPFIIGQDLIQRFHGRVVNLHSAPLPEWRGGGGFSWRILAGDRRGAATIHLVTPGIDDGPILVQEGYTFPRFVRYPADHMAFSEERDAATLVRFLDGTLAGDAFPRRHQDDAGATYFPRLHTPTHGAIDWSLPAAAVERFVLAFSYPYDGARTFLGDRPVHIMDATALAAPVLDVHPFMAGIVTTITTGFIDVCCGGGMVRVPREHLRTAAAIRPGDRFVTPPDALHRARAVRVTYSPAGPRLPADQDCG